MREVRKNQVVATIGSEGLLEIADHEMGGHVVLSQEEAFEVARFVVEKSGFALVRRFDARDIEEAPGGPSDPQEVFDPGIPQDSSQTASPRAMIDEGIDYTNRRFWETATTPPPGFEEPRDRPFQEDPR